MSVYSRGDLAPHSSAPATGHDRKRLVLLVAPQPVRTLELAALSDVFHEANRISKSAPHYRVRVVSTEPHPSLAAQSGFGLSAAASITDCMDPADTLIVCGYEEGQPRRHQPALWQWLQRHSMQSRRLASISTGTCLLAEAGLLNGKRAAAHWSLHDSFAKHFPRVHLVQDALFIRDGRTYTCAGGAAALDFALALVEEDLGTAVAAAIARTLLLYVRRTGRTRQLSVTLQAQSLDISPLADLLAWLPDHLTEDLSVCDLAKRSAMSPRNFARLFKQHVGKTPARHIEDLRLECAQRLLESSTHNIEGIAAASGFGTCETLRRLFIRRLGTTPGRFRASLARGRQGTRDTTSLPTYPTASGPASLVLSSFGMA